MQEIITDYTLIAIAAIAAIGTIVALLDSVGFLPPCISKAIYRNRVAVMASVLKEMGFKAADGTTNATAISTKLDERLAEATILRKVTVGKIETATFQSFIDLQGNTTDQRNAIFFARQISTMLRKEKKFLSNTSAAFDVDFVACPKGGSPILAYEFANLIRAPLLLHNETPKFDDDKKDIRAVFDVASEIATGKGKSVLIVDDSTTGGRKVLDTVAELRDREFQVLGCAVVFEPIGKGAREKLKEQGVELFSVTEGPRTANG